MLEADIQVSRLTDMHNYKCSDCDCWLLKLRGKWVCMKCTVDKLEDE